MANSIALLAFRFGTKICLMVCIARDVLRLRLGNPVSTSSRLQDSEEVSNGLAIRYDLHTPIDSENTPDDESVRVIAELQEPNIGEDHRQDHHQDRSEAHSWDNSEGHNEVHSKDHSEGRSEGHSEGHNEGHSEESGQDKTPDCLMSLMAMRTMRTPW